MPGSDNDVDSGLKQSTPPDMDIPEADLGLVLQNHDIYTVMIYDIYCIYDIYSNDIYTVQLIFLISAYLPTHFFSLTSSSGLVLASLTFMFLDLVCAEAGRLNMFLSLIPFIGTDVGLVEVGIVKVLCSTLD